MTTSASVVSGVSTSRIVPNDHALYGGPRMSEGRDPIIALAPAPQLPASTVTALGDAAAARAETIFGAVWRLKAVAAKGDLAALMLSPPDGLSAESILAAAEPADLAADKLYLAAIAYEEREYRIAVRELDCRTRQLGPRIERSAATTSELAWALWTCSPRAFRRWPASSPWTATASSPA